jgi:hypothetical protein
VFVWEAGEPGECGMGFVCIWGGGVVEELADRVISVAMPDREKCARGGFCGEEEAVVSVDAVGRAF